MTQITSAHWSGHYMVPLSPIPLGKHASGALLKKRREELGLTQEQVVEGTTVPNGGYLSNLESGNINVARSKHFSSLAKFLRLSEEDIRSINPAAVVEVHVPDERTTQVVMFHAHPPSEEDARESFAYFANTRIGRFQEPDTAVLVDENTASAFGVIGDEPYIVVTKYSPEIVETFKQSRAQSLQASLPRLRPIPPELAEMIEEKGHLAEELQTERWQQYLAGQRFSTGRATPERWWNLFLVLKNAGVEPGGN